MKFVELTSGPLRFLAAVAKRHTTHEPFIHWNICWYKVPRTVAAFLHMRKIIHQLWENEHVKSSTSVLLNSTCPSFLNDCFDWEGEILHFRLKKSNHQPTHHLRGFAPIWIKKKTSLFTILLPPQKKSTNCKQSFSSFCNLQSTEHRQHKQRFRCVGVGPVSGRRDP